MLALRSKKIANCHSVLLSIIRCACEDGVGDEIRTFVEVKMEAESESGISSLSSNTSSIQRKSKRREKRKRDWR